MKDITQCIIRWLEDFRLWVYSLRSNSSMMHISMIQFIQH